MRRSSIRRRSTSATDSFDDADDEPYDPTEFIDEDDDEF